MDVQGYMPHRSEDPHQQQVLHYAQVNLTPEDTSKTHSLPPLASIPPHVSNDQDCADSVTSDGPPSCSYASSLPVKTEDNPIPAIPASVFDKRKSSPAVLGLPLGLNDEAQAQLSLHLSQQRNSIEAAMLLANFNRLPPATTTTCQSNPSTTEDDEDQNNNNKSWPDDNDNYSVTSNTSDSNAVTTTNTKQRRHSYDVNMSWATMSPSFLERSSFYHGIATTSTSGTSSSASSLRHHPGTSHPHAGNGVRMTWVHGGGAQQGSKEFDPLLRRAATPEDLRLAYGSHVSLPPASSFTTAPFSSSSEHPMLHPLARSVSDMTGRKRDPMGEPLQPPPHPHATHHHHYYNQHYPPPPYSSGALPPMHHPSSSSSSTASSNQAPPYYYQHQPPPHPSHHHQLPHGGKLPLPVPMEGMIHTPLPGPYGSLTGVPAAPRPPTRRKKARVEVDEDDMANAVEPGDPDFPDMSLKDIEAARVDPEARPRRQKLRYAGDKYTPQWVRYNGQAKEGLCDTCRPGKWLQLKNSAFWYHKQFFHGISSVSGKEFMQPLETRWVDQDLVEGLCHQCHQWVSVSNVKRKNSVLWYRHAHKCHVYHKPKPNAPKRR
ncbi:hypothetical protein LRAMOSA04365 [Lichtheimia ramosa]|uniref:Transcription regulator Rua1 C-terminal domain-containing protein n=1 Tax=Lichtheimia ramosa TaxID=688394 RepID=A0A077WY26_9FUNG|nr:hypothetical protein LRAMOSA04365 [Lichtheimia ramosa]